MDLFRGQAAIATPGNPRDDAMALNDVAATLRADTGMWGPMQSPLRYLFAAKLVQAGTRWRFRHQPNALLLVACGGLLGMRPEEIVMQR